MSGTCADGLRPTRSDATLAGNRSLLDAGPLSVEERKMPSIRHVAIMCENPSAMAEFYKDVFELEEVWRHGQSVYMTDGVFSLVLLKAREGVKQGINHFGLQIEDMEEIARRL